MLPAPPLLAPLDKGASTSLRRSAALLKETGGCGGALKHRAATDTIGSLEAECKALRADIDRIGDVVSTYPRAGLLRHI